MSQLHSILLGCGFQYAKAQHLPNTSVLKALDRSTGFYVKNYDTTEGIFQIALSFPGDPHIELPYAILLDYPEQLKRRLIPHVNLGHFLCYVQEMEADWDPNDLQAICYVVDNQIQVTLDDSIRTVQEGATSAEALEGEFGAYWVPDSTLYLLSDPSESKELNCRFAEPKTVTEQSSPSHKWIEWVAFREPECMEYRSWLRQRNLKANTAINFPAHHVQVRPSRLVGEHWPPRSFSSLLKWLSDVDPGARARIAECIARRPVKRHVILMDVADQDIVGIFIELDLKALALPQHSRPKQSAKRKTTRSPHVGKLAASLSSPRSVTTFVRLGVVRADKDTILSRNRQRSKVGDLRDKRIALLGCGTIGGHLAGLLLRAGAGCGSGAFDLFDSDTFSPGNFGRHPLNTSEIGQIKSSALANTLASSTHVARNIEGKGKNFPITASEIGKYDIIIDATGRPPVSKRLAAVALNVKGQRPILIHGFNDGNGRASKVLVDDGGRCYGCMISDPAFYKNGIDMRFKGIDLQGEKRVSCGSTYTPYDAAVSVVTAGIMQEAALNCLENQPPWTYSEHLFDNNRSRRSTHISRQKGCKICNAEPRNDV